MHCDTMRRNPLKNKKKMRISFQPVDNPDKVNTHLLSWLLAACSMIGPFATDMYLPSFHQMAQAFGSDLAGVQMTLSSYLAGFAVMTLFYGTISDMFGRKLTMVTGFLCFRPQVSALPLPIRSRCLFSGVCVKAFLPAAAW